MNDAGGPGGDRPPHPASFGTGAALPHGSIALVHDVRLAFARSPQTVVYIMAATFLISLAWVPRRNA